MGKLAPALALLALAALAATPGALATAPLGSWVNPRLLTGPLSIYHDVEVSSACLFLWAVWAGSAR